MALFYLAPTTTLKGPDRRNQGLPRTGNDFHPTEKPVQLMRLRRMGRAEPSLIPSWVLAPPAAPQLQWAGISSALKFTNLISTSPASASATLSNSLIFVERPAPGSKRRSMSERISFYKFVRWPDVAAHGSTGAGGLISI